MKTKKYEIWDLQHHIVPEFYREEMERRGIKPSGLSFPAWSVEKSLSMMKAWNISRAFLSISTPGVHFGDDMESRELSRKCNDYLKKCADDYPERFGALASVPLPDVDGAIDELKYALDEKQMDG